ncbi:lysophospholipid acyltransferase family protein [Parerythrobacter aestuarii]|uniref:lysophospholipid acyltransferase family protein n=1 Tax=Parerythrobacter aestuarii TaxID=3020909 RepID=UPI0024DDF98A|nr:lysophospholipid acyltransferase family protein [Parerythrobacter aestuarii]
MLVLRNLCFYAAYYIGSTFYVIIALLAFLADRKLFRRVVKGWGGYHRDCMHLFLHIEIKMEGGPIDQPALYAIKHESFFEALDAPQMFSFPVVFAKKELFRIPVWGYLAGKYGLVPVDRSAGARALMQIMREARQKADEGRPLVIFPEGTRVSHGEQRQLQSGFSGIYKMVKLPVVPVAVDSGPLYHRRLKKPGTITYRFGEPIPPGLPREEVEARTLAAINALNG